MLEFMWLGKGVTRKSTYSSSKDTTSECADRSSTQRRHVDFAIEVVAQNKVDMTVTPFTKPNNSKRIDVKVKPSP